MASGSVSNGLDNKHIGHLSLGIAAAKFLFLFVLIQKEIKIKTKGMLPPALPILNTFFAVFIASLINYSTQKAKSAFPLYARPAPFVVASALGSYVTRIR